MIFCLFFVCLLQFLFPCCKYPVSSSLPLGVFALTVSLFFPRFKKEKRHFIHFFLHLLSRSLARSVFVSIGFKPPEVSSPVQFVLLYDLLSSCFGSNVLFSPPCLPSLIITSSFTVTLLLPLYLCCSYLFPPVFLPPSSVYFLSLSSLDWYPAF